MTDTLSELLAIPDVELEPPPTLADLGLEWDFPPVTPVPTVPVPNTDATTLDEIAERYRPAGELVAPQGKGRKPPCWNDPRVLALLGHLEAGAGRGQAVTAAGLAERTVMRWLETGRKEAEQADTEYVSLTFYRHFWQAFVRAEAIPMIRALDAIHRAAQRGGWRAAAWFLERRYPDTWGPRATAWKREQAWRQGGWESTSSAASRDDLEIELQRLLGLQGP
jgi:hypothetical protein